MTVTAVDERLLLGACEDCHGPALTWFAPNALWNLVIGGPDATDDPGGMLCPNCFIKRAEAAGIVPTAWVLDTETLPPSAVEAAEVVDADDKMEKISALIARLQQVLDRYGDTCVYIRRGGLSWGAVALNRQSDDQQHGVFDLQATHDREMGDRLKQIERLIADRNEWRSKAWAAEKASPLPASDAVRDVLAERQRQVTAEGWTPEHDDQHVEFEMASAAGVYALAAGTKDRRFIERGSYSNDYFEAALKLWPWDRSWWKPKDRRRDLVKAGALILAEIERLDRARILSAIQTSPEAGR